MFSMKQSHLYSVLFLQHKIILYFVLSYRHECFTGKYTTRKIHKNFIRDPSGLFP